MTDDRRFIEAFLPIQAISEEASREKSVRYRHISTFYNLGNLGPDDGRTPPPMALA